MTDTLPRIVICPNCRKPAPWSEANRFRPFCSERCRLIDLGAWASEAYRMPAEDASGTSADESEDQD
jgi:hypothetical protein